MNNENEPNEDLSTTTDPEYQAPLSDTGDATEKEHSTVQQGRGGGLALIMASVALIATGYMWYQNWQTAQSPTADNYQVMQQQLAEKHKNFTTELKSIQDKLATTQQKLTNVEQQLSRLQQTETPQAGRFDNQNNEAQFELLNQRLQQQNQHIEQLQQTISSGNAENTTVLPPNSNNQLSIQFAMAEISAASIVLDDNRVSAAISLLTNAAADLAPLPELANQVNTVINQLEQLQLPDVVKLNQQLVELGQALNSLAIQVEPNESAEKPWYERFVSVKKIADTQQPNNSAELLIAKSRLNQYLLDAKLALIVKDQKQWRMHTQAAADLIKNEFPTATVMLDKINALSQQQIRVEVPSDINLNTILVNLRAQR